MKTIEEKAKRYDEAIKVAKSNYETIVQMDNDCTFAKEGIVNTFHHMFPELKESDDEKIRKEIMSYIKSSGAVTNKQWLAWLEKQGEQKEATCVAEIIDRLTPKEQEILFKELEMQKSANKVEPKFKVGDEISTRNEESLIVTRIDRWGYWSDDLFICTFDDADKWNLVEHRSSWSEEDVKMIGTLIAIFEVNYPDSFYKVNPIDTTNMQGIHSSEIIKWLKSLKDRVQPNQEWSEEDKNKVNNLYVLLDQMVSFNMLSNKDATEFKDWLKSLRPQL